MFLTGKTLFVFLEQYFSTKVIVQFLLISVLYFYVIKVDVFVVVVVVVLFFLFFFAYFRL